MITNEGGFGVALLWFLFLWHKSRLNDDDADVVVAVKYFKTNATSVKQIIFLRDLNDIVNGMVQQIQLFLFFHGMVKKGHHNLFYSLALALLFWVAKCWMKKVEHKINRNKRKSWVTLSQQNKL